MRLFKSLILTAKAHITIDKDITDIDHHSVGDALLNEDIYLTPCQADHYRKLGFNITDEVTLPGDGFDLSCDSVDSNKPKALQVTD